MAEEGVHASCTTLATYNNATVLRHVRPSPHIHIMLRYCRGAQPFSLRVVTSGALSIPPAHMKLILTTTTKVRPPQTNIKQYHGLSIYDNMKK